MWQNATFQKFKSENNSNHHPIIQLSKNVKQTIPILQSKEYIQTIIKESPK